MALVLCSDYRGNFWDKIELDFSKSIDVLNITLITDKTHTISLCREEIERFKEEINNTDLDYLILRDNVMLNLKDRIFGFERGKVYLSLKDFNVLKYALMSI